MNFQVTLQRSLLFAVVFVAIWLFRSNIDLFSPGFTGEDFPVFWWQAQSQGITSAIQPYAGYFHLVPRLAGVVALGFTPEQGPLAFILVYCSALLLLAWAAIRSNPVIAACVLAAILLAPNANEVAASITYFQWVSAPILVALYLAGPPGDTRSRVLWSGAMLVAGLSGPFSALVAPMAVMELLYRKAYLKRPLAQLDGRDVAALAVIAFGLVSAAAYFLVGSEQIRPGGGGALRDYLQLARDAFRQVFGMLAQGTLDGSTTRAALVAAAALACTVLGWKQPARIVLFLFGSFVAALAIYKFRDTPDAFANEFLGSRYFFIGTVCIVGIALLSLAGDRLSRAAGLALLVVCSGAYSNGAWRAPPPVTDQNAQLTSASLASRWSRVFVNPFWNFIVVRNGEAGPARLLWASGRDQVQPVGLLSVVPVVAGKEITLTGGTSNPRACGFAIPLVSNPGRQFEAGDFIRVDILAEAKGSAGRFRHHQVVSTSELGDWSVIHVGTELMGEQTVTLRITALGANALHVGVPAQSGESGWQGATESHPSFPALVWPTTCQTDSPFGELSRHVVAGAPRPAVAEQRRP
jgi:hypothetical protein